MLLVSVEKIKEMNSLLKRSHEYRIGIDSLKKNRATSVANRTSQQAKSTTEPTTYIRRDTTIRLPVCPSSV